MKHLSVFIRINSHCLVSVTLHLTTPLLTVCCHFSVVVRTESWKTTVRNFRNSRHKETQQKIYLQRDMKMWGGCCKFCSQCCIIARKQESIVNYNASNFSYKKFDLFFQGHSWCPNTRMSVLFSFIIWIFSFVSFLFQSWGSRMLN